MIGRIAERHCIADSAWFPRSCVGTRVPTLRVVTGTRGGLVAGHLFVLSFPDLRTVVLSGYVAAW